MEIDLIVRVGKLSSHRVSFFFLFCNPHFKNLLVMPNKVAILKSDVIDVSQIRISKFSIFFLLNTSILKIKFANVGLSILKAKLPLKCI